MKLELYFPWICLCPIKTYRRTLLYFPGIYICAYYSFPWLYVQIEHEVVICCFENFTLLDCNTVEGIVIFQCVLHVCWWSFTFNQEHVFPPGKVVLPPLQPLVHSILQCLVISVMVFLQAFFQRTKQVIIRWCEVRTVGWMWQYSQCRSLWWPVWCTRLCAA
jgi:hypothetical protein